MPKRTKLIIAILGILLFVGGLGYYWFAKDTKQTEREPSQVFASQSECERTTNTKCEFRTCDSVSKGKSFEEVCGKDFRNGWVSVEDLGSDTEYIARGTVLDINLEPLSRDGDGMLTLRSRDGKRVKVTFPAGEFRGCKRPFTVMDTLNRVAVGDTVEVSGEAKGSPLMAVTVCSSEKHYLKIIGKEIPNSTTGNPVCGNGVCEEGEGVCMLPIPAEQIERYPTGGGGQPCQPTYCPQDCPAENSSTFRECKDTYAARFQYIDIRTPEGFARVYQPGYLVVYFKPGISEQSAKDFLTQQGYSEKDILFSTYSSTSQIRMKVPSGFELSEACRLDELAKKSAS